MQSWNDGPNIKRSSINAHDTKKINTFYVGLIVNILFQKKDFVGHRNQ
jgi:hypothetical protein